MRGASTRESDCATTPSRLKSREKSRIRAQPGKVEVKLGSTTHAINSCLVLAKVAHPCGALPVGKASARRGSHALDEVPETLPPGVCASTEALRDSCLVDLELFDDEVLLDPFDFLDFNMFGTSP